MTKFIKSFIRKLSESIIIRQNNMMNCQLWRVNFGRFLEFMILTGRKCMESSISKAEMIQQYS